VLNALRIKTLCRCGALSSLVLAGLTGCDENTPSQAETKTEAPSAPQQKTRSLGSGLKIHGLYIGMDILEVQPLLSSKLPQGTWKVSLQKEVDQSRVQVDWQSEVGKGDSEVKTLFSGIANLVGSIASIAGGFGGAVAGPDGKVTSFWFTPTVVDELFNTADMDASAFVEEFAKSYRIQGMAVADDRQSWSHTTQGGVKVTIGRDKSLSVEKVAGKKERRFE
jgi:hypothetical protein